MPICVNLWSIKNHLWSEFFLSTDYHRLSQISFLIPNSRALFPHVSDYSLQRLRFWVPTSQMYQHRALGTSRRHGVHHHTTPFHSTASKAALSLPRRAVLALWGSTSKLHFYFFIFGLWQIIGPGITDSWQSVALCYVMSPFQGKKQGGIKHEQMPRLSALIVPSTLINLFTLTTFYLLQK